MTDSPADEMPWPDGSPDIIVRDSFVPGTVLHGGLTGVIPPLPLSSYEGTVFEFELQCSDTFSANDVQLLPSGDPVAGTSGALLNTDAAEQIVPKVSSVTVTCGVAPTAPEPDADIPDGGLPSSGSGPLSTSDGGSSATLWLMIGALVVAAAVSACFGPARRAAAVDPVVALRDS